MSQTTASREPLADPRRTGIDEQLWPIVCATAVLVGILGVVVCVNSDFDEENLFLNAFTQLAGLALGAALWIYVASRLKGAARRTAELAIILSLALHAVGGVAAYYLFSVPFSGSSLSDEVRGARQDADDESLPTDYRWDQDQDQETEQAFEKVVTTTIREQVPPAAQVQARDMARPVQAVEVPRAPHAEITPLGVGGGAEPGGPLEMAKPNALKGDEARPPEALAMVRQKPEDLPLPRAQRPAPVIVPASPQEPPKTPEPGVATEKAGNIDWAAVAQRAATPNNEPLPPPHKMARVEVQPGEALPPSNIIARLPSQAPPQISAAQAGAEAADQITQQGSTLQRSARDGAPLPSTVVPDAGLPAQFAPAAGNSLPTRLDAVSTVPVEKSDTSRAPLGPTIASAGAQDYGRGSMLLPTRRGALDNHGKALPSIEGDSRDDPAELRSGAPGSDLNRGMALPSSSARQAVASQTEDGGIGASAGIAARLPRTQSEMAWDLPAAAKIVESSTLAGAGGVGGNPGGATSMLEVGPRIILRRSAGSDISSSDAYGVGAARSAGAAAGSNYAGSRATGGVGDVLLGSGTGPGGSGTGFGGGSGVPRRVEPGLPEGDDNGIGNYPRSPSESFAPQVTAAPAGPVNGTASITSGSTPGGASQGFGAAAAIRPNDGLGGIARREGGGLGVGSRPSGPIEPSDVAMQVGSLSPAPTGAGGRGGHGDGQLEQILSGGGSGAGGVGHGNSPVVVSGEVHEPMEAFRRGPMHGSPGIGQSAGGQLTEPAIENGLEYFSRTQFNDGHWSLHSLPEGIAADQATLGSLHADTAATGLALLTYLGAGYTHEDEKYRDVVRRGLEWLVKHQGADGDLAYHGSDPAYNPKDDPTRYYSQGIAAIALCEAYGMTQDRELREAAQKAIDFIVKSQDPRRGGWRYESQNGSDTSVTGWQLMALKSAQMAGLQVPDETLRKVSHWLDLAEVPNRGTYVYNPWNTDRENALGRAPNPTMTAQAMIMRLYLGQDRGNSSLALGADYVLAHLPDAAAAESPQRDCYYWYYATQAMYHMQGDYWKTWDARVGPLLRADQVDRGPLKGSWDPRQPAPDRWAAHGGRHYVTSLRILTLEFRYWHLPLFRDLRKD